MGILIEFSIGGLVLESGPLLVCVWYLFGEIVIQNPVGLTKSNCTIVLFTIFDKISLSLMQSRELENILYKSARKFASIIVGSR